MGKIVEGLVIDDKYKVGKVIGKGGQAEVFLAEDLSLNRVGAIKVLHWNQIHDDQLVKRFTNEAKIGTKFDHPGVRTTGVAGGLNSPERALLLAPLKWIPLSPFISSVCEMFRDQ
ncbi:MAG: hypothetical protein WA705_29100, partial [Candidatus Ozemobacteraceae bacterium]